MSQTPTPNWVDAAIELRRRLHQRPELAWQERGTAERIRGELEAIGVEWRACADTGTIATLAPAAKGRHVALRADIDALPLTERSGVEWASEVDGRMHACGHDGHTAALVAAARWMKSVESELPGPVTLLFQPAEEGGHGARRMIDEGALAGVDVVFGWHNWPLLRFGQALCPDGVVMAGNGLFEIVVTGRGGHSSQPEACRDSVLAGSAIVLALQQVVSRRVAPQHATVVSVTCFEGPSGPTIVPERVRLAGSYRVARVEQRADVEAAIREVAEATARAHGTAAEVKIEACYDPTINHAAAAAEFRAAVIDEFGAAAFSSGMPTPIMGSEDFSEYLRVVPGAFGLIGGDDGRREAFGCHSERYDFNDALLAPMVRCFARWAGAPLPPSGTDA